MRWTHVQNFRTALTFTPDGNLPSIVCLSKIEDNKEQDRRVSSSCMLDSFLMRNMEEQREAGQKSRPVPITTLNYNCHTPSSTLEDSKDYFQVIPVPICAANLHANTSRKLSRMIDNKNRKTSLNKIDTGLIKTNENKNRQKSTPSSLHGKTSPAPAAWKAESTDNTKDLSDWLLLGKSIQDPGCSSAKKDQRNLDNELYFLPKKAEESGKNHFCSGLHTYPPSIAKCSDPEHFRKINSENENYSGKEDHHHWFPSFSSRPLGEPCTTPYNERQRLRNKTNVGAGDKKLDEIIAAGRQAQFSQRKTVSPLSSRMSSSAQLLRSSSSSSLTKFAANTSRSRSISLPTQTSLHYNVVFDWKEKRNNGITYITPLFQTSEPERFSHAPSSEYDNEPSCAEHEVKMDKSYSEDLSLEHDD